MEKQKKNLSLSKNNLQITTREEVIEQRLAFVLADVNMLIPFKRDSSEISDWAKMIASTMSHEDLKKIPLIMKGFATEQIPFDNTLGIRNIFRALIYIEEVDGELQIRKVGWP